MVIKIYSRDIRHFIPPWIEALFAASRSNFPFIFSGKPFAHPLRIGLCTLYFDKTHRIQLFPRNHRIYALSFFNNSTPIGTGHIFPIVLIMSSCIEELCVFTDCNFITINVEVLNCYLALRGSTARIFVIRPDCIAPAFDFLHAANLRFFLHFWRINKLKCIFQFPIFCLNNSPLGHNHASEGFNHMRTISKQRRPKPIDCFYRTPVNNWPVFLDIILNPAEIHPHRCPVLI